jgi:hypothetical protein
MGDVKGMIQFEGATYRIVKVDRGTYDVIRILDEARIGRFETVPKLRVHPEGVAEKLLSEIAVTALKQAKISWQNMQSQRPPPKSSPSSAKVPAARPSRPRAPASVRLRAAKPT